MSTPNQQITPKLAVESSADKFITIFSGVHNVSSDKAKLMFETEKFSFLKKLDEQSLSDCSPISITGAFLDVISNGLSFDKASKHVYLMSRNAKKGDAWEKRLIHEVTVDGIIFLASNAESISHVSRPIIVYAGDHIEIKDGVIHHSPVIPRQSGKIVGGFCYLHYSNGRNEGFWMDVADIPRLASYSAKQNKGTANALYTSGLEGQIDIGFFQTKILKQALKNMRTKPVHGTSRMLSDIIPDDDDYQENPEVVPTTEATTQEFTAYTETEAF